MAVACEPADAAGTAAFPGRSLIAAVGHRFWRDRSAGPVWLDRAAGLDWPAGVTLDDYSFGAVAMSQQLAADGYDRALFLTAEERDREPGSLHLHRHEARAHPPEHVQACISEAGGGVVAIDLLLVVGGHLRALPPETWVLEVEPVATDWGDGLSSELDALYPRVLDHLRAFAAGRPVTGPP